MTAWQRQLDRAIEAVAHAERKGQTDTVWHADVERLTKDIEAAKGVVTAPVETPEIKVADEVNND